ncbi:MAG: hypothetical protein RJB68_1836 [Pseudomonadota bacterium]|jgi:hypothetical protein
MKNVTITVEDATLEWVRIEAARRNTSVSRLVGEMLTEKMQHDDAYARAQRDWVADTSSFSSGGKAYPPRDAGFAAGPPQGETRPLGGQRMTRSAERGGQQDHG